MSHKPFEHLYIGKTGMPIVETNADIGASQISDNNIASGTAINSGYLTFVNCAREENGTGVIKKVIVNINNDDTPAICKTNLTQTAHFSARLWLFNSIPTSQISGSALSGFDALMSTCYGFIDLNDAELLGTFNSLSVTECDFYYVCASENTYLYGVLQALNDTQFDASASMTVRLINEIS